MRLRSFFCFFLVLLSLMFPGCAREEGPGRSEDDGKITIRVDGIPVRVEVADNSTERRQGLMFRATLPANEGMLFVFDREQFLSFWMKDTTIPLSIAFVSRDGKIVAIRDMEPLDERTLHQSPRPALYALEMNRGWFGRHEVAVGDRVEFLSDRGR